MNLGLFRVAIAVLLVALCWLSPVFSTQCHQTQIFTFGHNEYGELGDGTNTSKAVPVAVEASGVLYGKKIAGVTGGYYYYSLVFSSTGQVYSFGENSYGQLGDGSNTTRFVPVAVDTMGVLKDVMVVAVSCGSQHSLFLSSTGKVFGVGWNFYGQLGDGTNTDSRVPVAVSTAGVLNGKTITAISGGGWTSAHSLVLSSAGQVFAFGLNNDGQLGDRTNINRNTAVAIYTGGTLKDKTITAIAAGGGHSLVLSSTGQVFTFGKNDYGGQLGDGTTVDRRNVPAEIDTSGVLNGQTIVKIASGAAHSLVMASTGQVYAFGLNDFGQLGDGTDISSNRPVAMNMSGVLTGMSIVAMAGGGGHSLLLSSTGRVFSIGWNDHGQIGDGSTVWRHLPVEVSTSGVLEGKAVIAIAAARWHSMVLTVSLSDVTMDTPYLYIGQPNVQISWCGPENVKIELIRDGNPGMIDTIVANYSGLPPYIWANATVLDAPRTDYRFRISSTVYPIIAPATSDPFEIASVQRTISLVTSPSTYLVFGESDVQIGWATTGQVGNVKIELIRDDNAAMVDMIVANYSGSSPYYWATVAASDAPHLDYRFRVCSVLYQYICGVSTAPFEIDVVEKSIDSVGIPDTYIFVGQLNVPISWTSTGYLGNITIELIRDDDPETNDTIVAEYSGPSPFIWANVTASDAPRMDYRFHVNSASYPHVSPVSSETFEIDAQQKRIIVDAPTGDSEYLIRGSSVQLSWSTVEDVGEFVKIELRRPNGYFTSIVSKIGFDASPLPWTADTFDGIATDYFVRISSLEYPSVYGDSPLFEIDSVEKRIQFVTAPKPYIFVGQSDAQVAWIAYGQLRNMKIELIRDGNPEVIDIITANHAGPSPYPWAKVVAGDARRTDFRFRVSCVLYKSVIPTVSDIFEIDLVEKRIFSIAIPTPYLYIGQQLSTISWESTGYIDGVLIELARSESAESPDVIAANYTGVSPFVWTVVNASDAPRSDFVFQITSNSYPSVTGASPAFEIDLFKKLRCPALLRAQLNASNAVPNSHFGQSLSMDRGRAVVTDSMGSVHVFVFDVTQREWKLESLIDVPGPNQRFGNITAMRDDIIVVNGAANSNEAAFVHRFNLSAAQWNWEETLVGPADTTGFGGAVTIGEGWIFVGASQYDQSKACAVLAYRWNSVARQWQLEQTLATSDAQFGHPSISVFGNQLALGCAHSSNQRGAVYTFALVSNSWIPRNKTEASDGTSGDRFGYSMALAKDTLFVGSPGRDGSRGAVYIFRFNTPSNVWQEQSKINTADLGAGDNFGEAVAFGGGTLIVGASGQQVSTGSIRIFEYSAIHDGFHETAWLNESTSETGSRFGSALSISGDWIAVGAPHLDIGPVEDAGTVFMFEHEARSDQIVVGQVRDGKEDGKHRLYQSSTQNVSANWDAFAAVMSFDGEEKNITLYNVTTIEKETSLVVLQIQVAFSISNPSPVFSFELPIAAELQHNHTYVTTIEASACSCCGIVESASTIGFLVDTTPPEIASVESTTSLLGMNETLPIEWTGVVDQESYIAKLQIVIVDATDNVSLSQQCGVLDGFPALPSSGQLNLTWAECGALLPPAMPLKVVITVTNGAGLTSTMLADTLFQVAGVRVSKLISWDSSSSTVMRVCRVATVQWDGIGIGNETPMMLALVEPSFPDGQVVVNITEHPISVGVHQFKWEPIPKSVPPGQYRVFPFLQQESMLSTLSASALITIESADACVEIISPNEKSRWVAGTAQTIEWDRSGNASSDWIFLTLSLGSQVEEIASLQPSTNDFKWVVPADQRPSISYRIRAISMNSSGVIFVTPPFEITAPTVSPSGSHSRDEGDNGLGTLIVGALSATVVILLLVLICAIVVIAAVVIVVLLFRRQKQEQIVDTHQQLESLNHSPSESKVQVEYNALEVNIKDLEFVERLGKGTFGIVYRAIYRRSNVAVKMLEVESEGLKEFVKEAVTMAQLQHPRLLQFVGFVNAEGKFGIVIEFMDRGSLDRLLWRKKKDEPSSSKLSWPTKMTFLNDIASGMVFIHSRGFIHRDLKSPNILISEANRAKIGDFGLARTMDKSAGTMTDKQGTPFWMAPEVVGNTGQYDNKCDVFSFGIIMWEVLTEQEPYFDVQNKQSVMFNVARDPNFRPTVPTWEAIMEIQSTNEERKVMETVFEQFTALMRDCWSQDPTSRPTFDQIVEQLHEMDKTFR